MSAGGREEAAPLREAERALVRVSAVIPARSPHLLRSSLEEARERADPEDVEEILLQSHLFAGYPLALEALAVWRDLRGEAPGGAVERDPEVWEERGPRVCAEIYGSQYEALRENVRRIHPAMERWMVVDGYGRVLGRPGPDLRTRELCVAALLAVLEAPAQLYSHLRGALNAGAPEAAVEATLEVAGAFASEEARDRAREVWERVRDRRGRRDGEGEGER